MTLSRSSIRPSPLDATSRPVTNPTGLRVVPSVLGARPPDRRRRRRQSDRRAAHPCPLCDIIPINMRQHIEYQHLPYWLHLEVMCPDCNVVFPTPAERVDHYSSAHGGRRDEEALAVRWLLACRNLLQVISELSGRPISELHLWVTEQGWVPETSVAFGAPGAALLRDLAAFLQLPEVGELSPGQPTSPVGVLHWRTLARIMESLPVAARPRIRSLPFPENNDGELAAIPLPPVIDAHCHLTTLMIRGLPLYEDGPFLKVGVIDNLVFPQEWSHPPHNLRGTMCSFGMHPVLASTDSWRWPNISHLFGSYPIIGECGLDIIRGPHLQREQEVVFRKHIRLAVTMEKPIILHLRGNDASVFYRAHCILTEENVAPGHHIYVHCFTADMPVYEFWIRRFPATVFGVSPATIRSADSQEFCRRADLSRVVLESDAPYLGRRAFDVLPQADHLANLRLISRRAVLGATCHTAARFFTS
jgi:Tat protein secretion system quality control protein TatD with DNase activity